MLGLIKKDLYLIIKKTKPIQFVFAIPGIFVATQNITALMPILTLVISIMLVLLASQTINFDEAEKWDKILSALPISNSAKAGSKYILLIISALLASIIILLLGLLVQSKGIITKPAIMLYAIFAFSYTIMYTSIFIPSAYKYGVDNAKYVIMIFIFIPVMISLVVDVFNIDLTFILKFIEKLNIETIILSLIFLSIVILLISFYMTKKTLDKKETA